MIMKFSLILLLYVISIVTFAMPCPGGGGILYKGDSIEDVLKQCGEPSTKKTNTITLNASQEWTYNKPHLYDQGYSQMILSFNNDAVTRIHVIDHYPYRVCRQSAVQVGAVMTFQTSCGDWVYDTVNTNLCGAVFGIGATKQFIQTHCGQPVTQNDTSSSIETTELIYDGSSPQTIVFQNGKLTEWK